MRDNIDPWMFSVFWFARRRMLLAHVVVCRCHPSDDLPQHDSDEKVQTTGNFVTNRASVGLGVQQRFGRFEFAPSPNMVFKMESFFKACPESFSWV